MNLVTGNVDFLGCEGQRQDFEYTDTCGTEGKYWEENKNDVPK